MYYKILDNALKQEDFKNLQQTMFSPHTSWYYNHATVNDDLTDGTYFFTHYMYGPDHRVCSDLFDQVYNLLNPLLDIRAIFWMRGNLTLKSESPLYVQWHRDTEPYKLFDDTEANFKTAILYMNTNNGPTILGKEEKYEVEAIENRLLVFDASTLHCNRYASDTKARIIININYA